MRRGFLAIVIVAHLAGAGAAWGQIYAPESLDRYFRLDWQATRAAKGPAIEGYVYNQSANLAERMRLVIEWLDNTGKVAGSSTVWVVGSVPLGGRAYFSASVPEAASYRVRVLSFDWAARGGG